VNHSVDWQELPELVYAVDRTRLPAAIHERYVALRVDTATARYFERGKEQRAGRLKTLLQRLLCRLMSDFDANALIDMYSMHLLSTEQWKTLLGAASGQLLDVGAGSGDITRTLAPLFDVTVTTDTSNLACRTLARRGFHSYRRDLAREPLPKGKFDLVSCLNVLDRCERPLSLVRSLGGALGDNGRLVVALALPYAPFYYSGSSAHEPNERLSCHGASFEEGVVTLVSALEQLGFRLERWTRAPYVSTGDAAQPFYVLDDVVVVMAPIGS
jgi:SAM-dependent methyltransferase